MHIMYLVDNADLIYDKNIIKIIENMKGAHYVLPSIAILIGFIIFLVFCHELAHDYFIFEYSEEDTIPYILLFVISSSLLIYGICSCIYIHNNYGDYKISINPTASINQVEESFELKRKLKDNIWEANYKMTYKDYFQSTEE